MFTDNKTWGVYSSILSEEGIDFVYSKSASTAYFELENRRVVVPVWEWMDEYAKQLLVSHEVGHAKFSDYTMKAYEEYVKEFKDLFNVVEDARIERLMKKEYLGLNSIFFNGYKVLVKNDIFEIPDDLSKCTLTERLNLYAKIGTYIEVPFFNTQEHTFAYRLMNLNTKSDVVSLCYDIKEYLKDHQEEQQLQQVPNDGNSDEETETGSCEQRSGEFQENSDKSNNENEELSGSKGSDSVDQQLTDNISNKMNENIKELDEENKKSEEENNKESETVYPKMSIISVDTKSYYDGCFFDYARTIVPFVKPTLTQRFYKTTTKMIQNLAKSATNLFKQKMSANENAMIKNRTVGKLDMMKVSKYAVSDNIFRNIKMLPKGKNHAIVILIDYSSSMEDSYQLMGEFIQACVFGEFCRINNIPFSIYAYGAYVNLSLMGLRNGYYLYRKEKIFESQTGVMLIGDNSHFDIPSIMWLANKRGVRKELNYKIGDDDFNFFISQNGTPTLEAVSIAYNKLKEYKKAGIEKTFLYVMTDGMYSEKLNCKQATTVDNYTEYNIDVRDVSEAQNVMIDNRQYSIKQYSKYFKNAFPELENVRKNVKDWTFEFFLGHIKKELGTVIVYSYVDSYSYMMSRMNADALTTFHPNLSDEVSWRKRYRDLEKIPNCYYFYKHFLMFESGSVKYEKGATFTYNFKNNPFIDQYIYLNTDVIKDMNISGKYAAKERIELNENTMDEYLKNNNAIIKIFEVMVRSFISIFS